MSFSSMFGSHHIPGRVWRPKIEVSQDNVGMVPPEELIIDPYLPTIAIDPFDPAGAVVIPSGRFVSIGYTGGRGSTNYRFTSTDTGKTTLSLHDGRNLTPAGLSINMMYKEAGEFMTDSNTVKFRTGFVAEVPFVNSINNAHGTLYAGDKLTGYWGSTTSTSLISYLHRGKPVKWNARRLATVTGAASAAQILTSAIYPGVPARVVTVFSSAGIISPTASLSFNGSAWVASFTGTGSGTTTSVVYDYGQDSDQIGGEVLRIQSLSDMLTRDDFLKWVEYAPQDNLNYPPAMKRFPSTQVGTGSDPDVNSDWETPSTVTAGSVYRAQHYPVSIQHPFLVAFKGNLTDMDGVNQTYTNWTILPHNAVPDARGYFNGVYHSVNWRTGVIELDSNITSVTAIKILYAYWTNPRDGAAAWGEGIINLTDGRNINNQVGIPSHLNLSDVVAAMRLIVR
jgi:hypothetical protein